VSNLKKRRISACSVLALFKTNLLNLRFLSLLLVFVCIVHSSFAVASLRTPSNDRNPSRAAQMATSSVALTSVTSTYPNQSVTLLATVSVNGAVPAPTGSVNFMLGTTLLGTGTLSPIDQSDSTATFAVNGSQLVIGSNAITGIYSGDGTYSGSTSPAITVTLNSSQVSFGTVAVGTPSAIQTLTYQFNVAGTLSAVNVLTSGISGLDYTDGGSSTCTVGNSYPAGGSCVVNVAFTPSAAGQRSGGVTLFAQGSTTPLMTWYLSGIGQSSAVTIDPGTQTIITAITGGLLYGSAVDGAGNVYVVDKANSQVFELVLAAGAFTQTSVVASGLLNPTAVALDGAGNLYISDTGNGRVVIVPDEQGALNSGDMSTVTTTGLASPRGIAIDGSGNLYVADAANNDVIELLSATGTTSTVASSLATSPYGVAVDASGNVYVAAGSSVTEYQPPFTGTPIPIGTGYNNASGVAVDAAGTVYVADSGNATIVEVAAGGASQATFALTGLVAPQSMLLDSADNLYVTDSANVIEVNRTQAAGLVFPSTDVGSTSTAQTLTVSNAGNQQLAISNLAITSNFVQVSSGGTDCTSSSNLLSDAQCLIAVAFAPTVSGNLTGSVMLTDNALNNPGNIQSVSLSGAGNSSSTVTTVSASPNPSCYGQSTTLSAVVSPTGSGNPTGSVTFTDGANTLGTITPSGGTAQLVTSSLSAGSHSVTASYSGDSNFSASSSTVFTLVVNQATSSLSLGSTGNTVYMQPVSFTATITPLHAGIATGTATFQDGVTAPGSTSVAGNSAIFTTSMLAVGSHSITATYSGDSNVTGSSSSALAEIVSKAAAVSTVSSSVNPSALEQPVTFTVVVFPQFGGVPTGTVVLKESSVVLSTLALSGGQANWTTSSLALGTSQITAVYAGDLNFAGSTSAILKQAVSKLAATTTKTTSSPNPATLEQAVTFTATVSSADGVPTDGGSVTFKNAGATLGVGTLSGGTATFTTSSLTAGSHPVIAIYSGNATFASSTSPTLTETVSKYGTSTTVLSSGTPSAFGQSITFVASVTPIFQATPTGTVTFKNGSTTLGTQSLVSGAATLINSTLPVGTHTITAVYNGDPLNLSSTSPSMPQVVTHALYPSMTPSATHINFANPDGSPLFPGQVGQVPITFTVTQGPITYKQQGPLCIRKNPSDTEYFNECDDITLTGGTGTYQTGDQFTVMAGVGADTDDLYCDPFGSKPAYVDGCEGIIQIKVPNSPTIIAISYSFQWANPAPQITISPTNLAFPSTPVGEFTQIESTIYNPGDVPLAISSIGVTSGTEFTQVDDCPSSLPVRQSCNVTVTFTPTKGGLSTGVISIVDNDSNNEAPKSISLSGTGTN
jgi:large repetitive protein